MKVILGRKVSSHGYTIYTEMLSENVKKMFNVQCSMSKCLFSHHKLKSVAKQTILKVVRQRYMTSINIVLLKPHKQCSLKLVFVVEQCVYLNKPLSDF